MPDPTADSLTPPLKTDADLARHEMAELTRLRAATWESQRASGKTGTCEFLKLLLAIHQQMLLLAGFQLESESSRRTRLLGQFKEGQGEHAAPPLPGAMPHTPSTTHSTVGTHSEPTGKGKKV